MAGIAFAGIGYLAFRLYGHFIARIKVEGGFSFAANNSFGQILPAFAFAMIVVGFSIVFSTFFFITASLIAGIALILGVRSMPDHGTNAEPSPLWHAARNCRFARRVTRPITSPNGAVRLAASSYIRMFQYWPCLKQGSPPNLSFGSV